MKCPKCGYNSFEYYDSCKKCSADLSGFKQTHSITSMVLPFEAREKLAADVLLPEDEAGEKVDASEAHDDIFTFDLPADEQPEPITQNADPFNFDEPLPEEDPFGSTQPSDADNGFSTLPEPSASEDSPFGDFTLDSALPDAAPDVAFDAAPETTTTAADTSGTVEFDLESFSWDDSPVADSAAPGEPDTNSDDAFDSLFGEQTEDSKK